MWRYGNDAAGLKIPQNASRVFSRQGTGHCNVTSGYVFFFFVFLDNLECVGESEVCLHIRWKSHVRNTDLGTRSHCRSVVLEKNLEKKEVKTTAVPSRRSFLEVLKQATEFLRVGDVSPLI